MDKYNKALFVMVPFIIIMYIIYILIIYHFVSIFDTNQKTVMTFRILINILPYKYYNKLQLNVMQRAISLKVIITVIY